MGHHKCQPGGGHRAAKLLRLDRIEWRNLPAIDVAGEYLQAVAAGVEGPLHRFREPSGNRLMGTHQGVAQGWPGLRSGLLGLAGGRGNGGLGRAGRASWHGGTLEEVCTG